MEDADSKHCAVSGEKGLEKAGGLSSRKTVLNHSSLVMGTHDAASGSKAAMGIGDLHFGGTPVKKAFPVMDMSCASCAAKVENTLKSQKGVLNASVNLATATVSVEYIPSMVEAADLKSAVQSAGYDLLTEENKQKSETLEDIHQKKLERLKRKTYWALALSIPVVVIGMFFMNMPYANQIMWIMSTPVVLWSGRDFFRNAWKQTMHRSANMDTLVALSTGVAYLFSVFNTLNPGFWHDRGLHAHVYFEASAVIVAFILLGKLLEEKAKGKTSSSIKKLMGLQPKSVTIVHTGGHQKEIPVEEVKINDIILVKPGEKIAVDGVVTEGNSYVDESMLSGEPVPVLKKKKEKVYAGTINQKGSFRFKAEKVGSETMLAQIIKMVGEAQGSKAPVQKLADKIAGIFVPVVILIAIASFAAWNIFGGDNGFTQGLLALITVLVIACPCALGLATPTAIMVGIGRGAEKGILIKDAESLELAKKINTVILDKTGTITLGKPEVSQSYWAHDDPFSKRILYSMEKQSEHPLADAVVRQLGDNEGIELSHFESLTGQGVKAIVDGERYFAGNKRLLEEQGISIEASFLEYERMWSEEAKTVIWFADSKKALAIFAVSDEIKPTSKTAIQELQNLGIEVYMLTGDNESTAGVVAEKAGVHHYKAGLLPEQKAAFVKQLQEKGKIVAMVGDGINDSTALAQADVSIAMGKGSDIAIDVAKMTIISSDLTKIPEAIRLSKSTVATIRQNLFWAFIYNLIGIPIAAGILYPVNGFLLNPMFAGAAMALSSVSVVTNSLRRLRRN